MEDELVLSLVKIFIFVTTPFTLLVGIFLLFDFDTYLKIEKFLSKSYFIHKDISLVWLNKSRNSVHLFLLSKRRLLGIICILNVIGVYLLANQPR